LVCHQIPYYFCQGLSIIPFNPATSPFGVENAKFDCIVQAISRVLENNKGIHSQLVWRDPGIL
jgi:hypothetical protein